MSAKNTWSEDEVTSGCRQWAPARAGREKKHAFRWTLEPGSKMQAASERHMKEPATDTAHEHGHGHDPIGPSQRAASEVFPPKLVPAPNALHSSRRRRVNKKVSLVTCLTTYLYPPLFLDTAKWPTSGPTRRTLACSTSVSRERRGRRRVPSAVCARGQRIGGVGGG